MSDLLFPLCSFSSFLLDYVLFLLLVTLFGSRYLVVWNVAARVISAYFNYSLNCRFVFHEKKTARTSLHYFLLALWTIVLNSFILWLLTEFTPLEPSFAKLLTEMTLFFFNWAVQKFLIFRHSGNKTERRTVCQ